MMEDWFIIVNYGKVIIRTAMEQIDNIWLYANGCSHVLDANETTQNQTPRETETGTPEITDLGDNTDPHTSRVYEEDIGWNVDMHSSLINDTGDTEEAVSDTETALKNNMNKHMDCATEEEIISQSITSIDISTDAEFDISSEEDLIEQNNHESPEQISSEEVLNKRYHEIQEQVSYKNDLNTQRHHESLKLILSEYLSKQTDYERSEPISPEKRFNQQQFHTSHEPMPFEDDLITEKNNKPLELTSSTELNTQNYHESLELIVSTSEGTAHHKPRKLVKAGLLDHISTACTTVAPEQEEYVHRTQREVSVTGSDEIIGDCDGEATEQGSDKIANKCDEEKTESAPAAIDNKRDGENVEPLPAAIAGKCDKENTYPTQDEIAGKSDRHKIELAPHEITENNDRATNETAQANIVVNSDKTIKHAHAEIDVNCDGEATERDYADIADKFGVEKIEPVSGEIIRNFDERKFEPVPDAFTSKCDEEKGESVPDASDSKCDRKKTEPVQYAIVCKCGGLQNEHFQNEIAGSCEREKTPPTPAEIVGWCDVEKLESVQYEIDCESGREKAELVQDDNHSDETPDESKSKRGSHISKNNDKGNIVEKRILFNGVNLNSKGIDHDADVLQPGATDATYFTSWDPFGSDSKPSTFRHSDAQIERQTSVSVPQFDETWQQFSGLPDETCLDLTTDCELPPGTYERWIVDNSRRHEAEHHHHTTNTFKSDSSTVYVHLLEDARQNLQYGDHNELFCDGQLNYADIQISKTMDDTTGHQGELYTANKRRKKTRPTIMRLYINKGIVQIGNGRQNPKIQCQDNTFKDCEHHRRYYCDLQECTATRGMQVVTLECPEIHLYVSDQITVQCGYDNTSFTIDQEYLENRTFEDVQTVARQFKALQTVTPGQVCVKVQIKPSESLLSRINDRACPCLTDSEREGRMNEDQSDRCPGSSENFTLGATEPIDFERFENTLESQISTSRSNVSLTDMDSLSLPTPSCYGLVLADNRVSGHFLGEPIGGEYDLECDITPVFDEFDDANGASVMCELGLEIENLKDVEIMTESGYETRQVHNDQTRRRQTRNAKQRKASWEEDETSGTQCENVSNTQAANLQRYFADSRCSCMCRWANSCLLDRHAVQTLVEDRLATSGFSQTLSCPSVRCVHESNEGSYIFTLDAVEIDETLSMKTFVENKLFPWLYGLDVYGGVYVEESTDVDIETTVCRFV